MFYILNIERMPSTTMILYMDMVQICLNGLSSLNIMEMVLSFFGLVQSVLVSV